MRMVATQEIVAQRENPLKQLDYLLCHLFLWSCTVEKWVRTIKAFLDSGLGKSESTSKIQDLQKKPLTLLRGGGETGFIPNPQFFGAHTESLKSRSNGRQVSCLQQKLHVRHVTVGNQQWLSNTGSVTLSRLSFLHSCRQFWWWCWVAPSDRHKISRNPGSL